MGRKNNQTGRGSRRWIVLLGVAGAHLVALWLLDLTLKFRARQTSDAPAMLWVQISPRTVDPPVVASRAQTTPRVADPTEPALAPPSAPPAPVPDAVGGPASFIDWTAAGQRAARDLLRQQSRDEARRTRMGSIPFSNFNAWQAARRSSRTPKFPGTRQPLSRWFDFDSTSYIATVTLGRCQVSVFLILPGFGCVLGRADPDAAPNDLFDRKYQVPPIEIPPPLVDPLAALQQASGIEVRK